MNTNQDKLLNELRGCRAETGVTFSDLCKQQLTDFTNEATTRQLQMQSSMAEAI